MEVLNNNTPTNTTPVNNTPSNITPSDNTPTSDEDDETSDEGSGTSDDDGDGETYITDELKQYSGTQMSFVKPFDIKQLPKPFDNPDIVVFHECYRPEYLKIAKNLRKNKIPYVDMPHGELRVEAQKKKHFKKVMANLLLFNDFANHAAAIQCLSNAEMEATHFGRKKFIGSNGISMPLTSHDCGT